MREKVSWAASLIGVVAIAGGVVATGFFGSPFRPTPMLLVNVSLVAVIATTIVALRGRGEANGWKVWIPWVACGALMGAASIATPPMATWGIAAGLCFGVAGAAVGLGGWQGGLLRGSVVVVAAVLNTAVLWPFVLGGDFRVPPAAFQEKELRVHAFLADVPLHDVWAFRLQGGDAPTTQDVRAILTGETLSQSNPAVVGLVAIRSLLGGMFGWDEERCEDPTSSYVHRLSESDRLRSVDEPEANGFLYTFENEALAEIKNCTVHAFLAWAWEPGHEEHVLYWAVYVKPVGGITGFYMALIDPFRRLFVYPTIIRHVEQGWAARRGA